MGRAEQNRRYKAKHWERLRIRQNEDRYMRRVLGICRSCDAPAERKEDGEPMAYCMVHRIRAAFYKAKMREKKRKQKEIYLTTLAKQVKVISVTPQEPAPRLGEAALK